MRWVLISIGLLGLAACGPSQKQKMAEITVSELKNELRDPSSLQLSETMVQVANGWGAICGRYNAANGYGGMAGSKRFVRVFNPKELDSLGPERGEPGMKLFESLQGLYRSEERREARAPVEVRKEPTRGLFMEDTDPILTLRYTRTRCVLDAKPIDLEP